MAKKKETKKKFKNGKCKVLIICYFSFFFSFSDVKNKIENKKEVLMAWKKYKLGELIELCDERNTEGITEFYGININKEFMPTVANTEGLDESKYKVVRKNRFVFSGMQTGRDVCIRISMYMKDNPIIVSPAYTTFEVKKTDIVSPTYFFMLFLSKEMDRLGWFCSDGSIRSNLDWDRFCDFDISLPSLDIQKQYAAVYQAACENAYQSRLDSLKTVCDGYIDKIKHTAKRMKLAEFSKECDKRNTDGLITSVNGVNKDKLFMPTVAAGEDLTKYKVVSKNQFACNLMHIGRDVVIPIALSSNECPFIVSPAYIVFSVNENIVLPDFAQLWLSRDEVGREAWFKCDSSVRSGMEKKRFFELEIPIPSINIQQDIVNIYQCYIERQRIAAQMKEQIKALCPVLIRGSLQE